MPTKLTTLLIPLLALLSLAAAAIIAGPNLAALAEAGFTIEGEGRTGPDRSTSLSSSTTEGPTPPPTMPTTSTFPTRSAGEPPPEEPAVPADPSTGPPTDGASGAATDEVTGSTSTPPPEPSPASTADRPPAAHPVLPATEAGNSIPAVAATAGSASYERSNKGHRLWLDIRFDLAEYQDVVVDYGDGTKETLVEHLTTQAMHVATDGTPPPPPTRWRTDHAYELTLIPVERPVTITWIGPSASDVHVETFTMISVAVFDLTFHPLTFTAQASCDWHSKGDFTVTWDQGLGWYTTPEFELGKGESTTIDEFSFTRGGVTAQTFWSEVLAIKMAEHDNLGSTILGYFPPNRWKAEFKGVPPNGHGGPRVVQDLADHTVTVTNERELGHECYVRVDFDATLDLYEG